jgi:DNA polymerase III subunit epsilon
LKQAVHAESSPRESTWEPSWQTPIEEAPLVFLDLEMTGLDLQNDRVIEVCCVRTKGRNEIRRLETLIRPEPIDEKLRERWGRTIAVHGIAPDEVHTAPTFAQIANELEALLAGAILIAHAGKHDRGFLRAEHTRLAACEFPSMNASEPLAERWGVQTNRCLDTLDIARRSLVAESYALSRLASFLGLSLDRPHRAGSDVARTQGVFWHCVDAMHCQTPLDVWQLATGATTPQLRAKFETWCRDGSPIVVLYKPNGKPRRELRVRLMEVAEEHLVVTDLATLARCELAIHRIVRVDVAP